MNLTWSSRLARLRVDLKRHTSISAGVALIELVIAIAYAITGAWSDAFTALALAAPWWLLHCAELELARQRHWRRMLLHENVKLEERQRELARLLALAKDARR